MLTSIMACRKQKNSLLFAIDFAVLFMYVRHLRAISQDLCTRDKSRLAAYPERQLC